MSLYVDSNKHQERFIYVIVADDKLVKAFSDKKMAVNAYYKMQEIHPNPERVLPPIGVRFIDSQAINTKGFDRIDFG